MNLLLFATAFAGEINASDLPNVREARQMARQAVRLVRQMVHEDIELWYEIRFKRGSAVVTQSRTGSLTVSAGCTPGSTSASIYGPSRRCTVGDATAQVPERIAQRFDHIDDAFAFNTRIVMDQSPAIGCIVTFHNDNALVALAP